MSKSESNPSIQSLDNVSDELSINNDEKQSETHQNVTHYQSNSTTNITEKTASKNNKKQTKTNKIQNSTVRNPSQSLTAPSRRSKRIKNSNISINSDSESSTDYFYTSSSETSSIYSPSTESDDSNHVPSSPISITPKNTNIFDPNHVSDDDIDASSCISVPNTLCNDVSKSKSKQVNIESISHSTTTFVPTGTHIGPYRTDKTDDVCPILLEYLQKIEKNKKVPKFQNN